MSNARSFGRPPAQGGSEQAPIGAAVPDMRTSGALRAGRPVRASRQRYLTVTWARKPLHSGFRPARADQAAAGFADQERGAPVEEVTLGDSSERSGPCPCSEAVRTHGSKDSVRFVGNVRLPSVSVRTISWTCSVKTTSAVLFICHEVLRGDEQAGGRRGAAGVPTRATACAAHLTRSLAARAEENVNLDGTVESLVPLWRWVKSVLTERTTETAESDASTSPTWLRYEIWHGADVVAGVSCDRQWGYFLPVPGRGARSPRSAVAGRAPPDQVLYVAEPSGARARQ